MNLRSARLVLRTRSAPDIIDLAAPFCLRGGRLLVALSGIVLLPAFTACLAVRHLLGWSWPAVWALAIGLGGLTQAPFTLACGDLLFHAPREIRILPLLRRALGRAPDFVVERVATRLIHVLAGVSLFLWPFTLSALFVADEAVLLEGAGPFAAMARSGRAVRGQALATLGTWIGMALLPVFGAVAGEISGSAIAATVLQLGEPFGNLWEQGGTPYALAGFFATVPLVAAVRFLKYIDLRTRKEGWDIQLRFMAIAASTPDQSKSAIPGGKAAA